jgi:hypothetical protein
VGITIHYGLENGIDNTKKNKELIKQLIPFVMEKAQKFGYEVILSENQKGFCQKSYTRYLNGTEDFYYYTSEFFEEDSDFNPDYKESGFKETENQKKVTFNSICVNNKVNNEFMSESFELVNEEKEL